MTDAIPGPGHEPSDDERRETLRRIHAEASSIPDVDEDEEEEDEELTDEEYLDGLAGELDKLYERAGRLGRNANKVSTGTLVGQLLAMQTRDAVLALDETLGEIRDLLAEQDARAAAVAQALKDRNSES